MRRLILVLIFIFAVSTQIYAGGIIPDGTYILNDGNMQMTVNIKMMPDGRYMVEGEGKNKEGKTCMLMGSAKIEDGKFLLDYCPMSVTYSNNKLEIKDTEPCAICDTGAYVSGTYEKQ